jgi:hypothetical protein
VPKNIYTFEIDDTVNKISLLEFKQNNKISFKFNEDSYGIANNIFNKFFKFNNFINNQIHEVNLSSKSLGIHYRGTDKNFDNGQSNSISCDEFLLIIDDYLHLCTFKTPIFLHLCTFKTPIFLKVFYFIF